ncbi:hypothetical protein [Candidatus Alkanophaga liquidiphilum]|nr:MAG: hypothetical protein DRN91_07720 [Candidatus Alkanophagales archaeon]
MWTRNYVQRRYAIGRLKAHGIACVVGELLSSSAWTRKSFGIPADEAVRRRTPIFVLETTKEKIVAHADI